MNRNTSENTHGFKSRADCLFFQSLGGREVGTRQQGPRREEEEETRPSLPGFKADAVLFYRVLIISL